MASYYAKTTWTVFTLKSTRLSNVISSPHCVEQNYQAAKLYTLFQKLSWKLFYNGNETVASYSVCCVQK
jgi:hypothetical protein